MNPRPHARKWAALLSVLMALGCSGATAHRTATTPSTADATVVAYYTYLGRHDSTDAAALMDPSLRREDSAAPGSDLSNVVSLTHIRNVRSMVAPSTPGLPGAYTDITQVFVTYDVVYRQEIASGNGANSRFVYLGRNASGQWRILAIGTGP